MKLKLDENLGAVSRELMERAGLDVATTFQQGLCGESDARIIETCREEERCLVTLDLDFGNPLRFKPSSFHGIAVIRLPGKPSFEDLEEAVRTLVDGLSRERIEGRLWIVQRGRIRIFQEEDLENEVL